MLKYEFFYLTGDTINFNSYQSSRVLFTGSRDYTTYFFGRTFTWQISHICYDTRFDKVSKSSQNIQKSIALIPN